MTLVERLRHKLSPLEDKEFTAGILPTWRGVDFKPYLRKYKGAECVMLSARQAWGLVFPNVEPSLYNLTVMGRSLQALLWERSYLKGELVFTKPYSEIESDGY